MREKLEGYIKEALKEFGITGVDFVVEHPGELAHGDWATNVAMTAYRGLAKATNSHVPNAEKAGIIWAGKAKNPRELAEAIVAKLKAKNYPDILKIEPAGPGFINFKLAPAVFEDELTAAISKGEKGNGGIYRPESVQGISYRTPDVERHW